jgi:quinol-cytochrome oxidoreductase complex cytochrome b subunit
MSHTVILAPFILAFLTYILRFYSREGAASMTNPSFLLAAGTVFAAAFYLFLGVIDMLPPYGTLGFGVVGVGLFGVAVARMFMI